MKGREGGRERGPFLASLACVEGGGGGTTIINLSKVVGGERKRRGESIFQFWMERGRRERERESLGRRMPLGWVQFPLQQNSRYLAKRSTVFTLWDFQKLVCFRQYLKSTVPRERDGHTDRDAITITARDNLPNFFLLVIIQVRL